MRQLAWYMWVLSECRDCPAPRVLWSSPTGPCFEFAQRNVPDGARCTARCAIGYTASETSLLCTSGQLNPATFYCTPRTPEELARSAAAPAFAISRCLENIASCRRKAGNRQCCQIIQITNAGDMLKTTSRRGTMSRLCNPRSQA